MARDFLRLKCSECDNEQIVFSHAATEVECLVCGEVIAEPAGGHVEVHSELVEQLSTE